MEQHETYRYILTLTNRGKQKSVLNFLGIIDGFPICLSAAIFIFRLDSCTAQCTVCPELVFLKNC
jgi:hypothetical protein